jgi:hypothetical protein
MAQPNVRVRVAATHGKEKDYKELFRRVVLDYCKRFKVKVTKGPWDVSIVIADYHGADDATGMTSVQLEDKKLIVQVREPYDSEDQPNNEVLNHTFFTVVCHEFVHCCQALTGRVGIKAKLLIEGDDLEEDNYATYLFHPEEVEARILDEYYVRYIPDSLREAIREINKKENT